MFTVEAIVIGGCLIGIGVSRYGKEPKGIRRIRGLGEKQRGVILILFGVIFILVGLVPFA